MYCRDWNFKNLLLKCVRSYFNIVVQLQTLVINICGLEFWLFSVICIKPKILSIPVL